MIGTLIIKPTKLCNANCTYCCAPANTDNKINLDDFYTIFSKLLKHLDPKVTVLWHGGEPMLMGPDFYFKCYEMAKEILPNVRFSIQTNLLLYKSSKWKTVFSDIFAGSISTSFDPDLKHRTINGSSDKYSSRFIRCLDNVLADGFKPLVIGTYDSSSIALAHHMYDLAIDKGFDIRVNYRFPAGRNLGSGVSITPYEYGKVLVELYDRWVSDCPQILVTPLDLMLKRVVGLNFHRCPWSKGCSGKIIEIEPNGDVYNCGEYSDLGESYKFGNIFNDSVEQIFLSQNAKIMRKRAYALPQDCLECRHFQECEGGCSRDSTIFGNGPLGKFYYCQSWKMVFDRIKQSVESGEADNLLKVIGA